jgi:hypothetical protein
MKAIADATTRCARPSGRAPPRLGKAHKPWRYRAACGFRQSVGRAAAWPRTNERARGVDLPNDHQQSDAIPHAPDLLVTDKLRSYGAAKTQLRLSARQEQGLRKNNRAENRTCRFVDASGRCNGSNRKDQRNGSWPFTPSSKIASTSNAILFPQHASPPQRRSVSGLAGGERSLNTSQAFRLSFDQSQVPVTTRVELLSQVAPWRFRYVVTRRLPNWAPSPRNGSIQADGGEPVGVRQATESRAILWRRKSRRFARTPGGAEGIVRRETGKE